MTEAQLSPKTQDAKPTTKGSNGTSNGARHSFWATFKDSFSRSWKREMTIMGLEPGEEKPIEKPTVTRRWFGIRLWDATRTVITDRTQRNDFRLGLTAGEEEIRDTWAKAIAKEAKGNPQVAKLVMDMILKAGNEYAAKLIDQFMQLYPTLSQEQRARIFGKLVDEFCRATSKGMFSELKATNLARIFEAIGKESKTTYKEDEGPEFADNVNRLAIRLKQIVEDDFNEYKECAAVRVAVSRVVWAFDEDLKFLEERLHDGQTAEFAVEAMMSTSEARGMLAAKVLNGDAKVIAQVMAGMPEEKVRNQLLNWIYRDNRLAVYAFNVIAMRKDLSAQLRLVIKSKLNDPDVNVKNAAMVAAVQHVMPEAIPYLKESIENTHNVEVKNSCIQAMAKFAAQGNEDAKVIVLDVLNGTDNQAKNLAIGHILVNKLTYTIPTMMSLFENKKGDKEVRANVEKAMVMFGFVGVPEAVAALPRIAEIRKQELTARILGLKHTAMQGKKKDREKAEEELSRYAQMGARAARVALHEIEQSRERSQPWKKRGKKPF